MVEAVRAMTREVVGATRARIGGEVVVRLHREDEHLRGGWCHTVEGDTLPRVPRLRGILVQPCVMIVDSRGTWPATAHLGSLATHVRGEDTLHFSVLTIPFSVTLVAPMATSLLHVLRDRLLSPFLGGLLLQL